MVRHAFSAALDRLVAALAAPIAFTAIACSAGDDTQSTPLPDASINDAAVSQDTTPADVGDVAAESYLHEASADATQETEAGEDGAAPASWLIASLNLHCLKTADSAYASNEERFAAIAKTVADEGIVAITVQEACVAGTVDALELLRAAISKATGETWSKQWTLAHVGWQGTPDEAQEGVGILARGALSDVTEVEFEHQGAMRRVMVGATLSASSGGLRLWSLHLELDDPATQVQQAREAAAIALAQADPSWNVALGGDFNAVKESPPLDAVRSMGFFEYTATLGSGLIDHIFVHYGASYAPGKARTLFDGSTEPKVSDHPGVLVELTPSKGAPVWRTRLIAHADMGQGDWPALRGAISPLDWGWGWPAWRRDDGSWLVVLSSVQAGYAFEYKWLINDSGWQTGANASCVGGSDCELSPQF